MTLTAKCDAIAGVIQFGNFVLLKKVWVILGDILCSKDVEKVGCLKLSLTFVVAEYTDTTVSCQHSLMKISL
eukprot:CAMPEP_0201098908 /NCGR_PEP_ID=MMETSP0812-20130820/7918_1 /ASSEMBLY_ACC=CAM_ASM_000668 /TAXON_ID=98059 /ORGANISM="Dinobryon sp., Strain UTEXLB2267" /LENGTH=71 /DNA_ID=CAMNT_0047354567 /DNA_START=265 /DNA_END=477 /DNA_ORIENTATION=+